MEPGGDLLSHWADLVGEQDAAWLESLSTSLIASLSNGEMDLDKVSLMTLGLAYEWGKRGNKARAQTLMDDLGQQMRANQSGFSSSKWGELVKLSQKLELQLSDSLNRFIVTQDLLSKEQQAELIKELQQRDDARSALQVARSMVSGADKLEVLVELEKLAKKAGDDGFASKLNKKIEGLQAAKETLEQAG